MADFDRNSTVKELDRIANLYDSKNELEYELYRIAQNEKDEIDEKASTIIKGLNDYQAKANDGFGVNTPVISPVCTTTPPPERPDTKNADKVVWIGALSGLACLGSLVLYIILSILGIGTYVSGLFTLLIIGTSVCWFVFGRFVGPYVDWRKKQTEWDKKFESYSDFGVQDRFLNECVEYEKRFLDVVADCSKVYDQEQAKYENMLAQIHSEYAEKSSKTQAELDNVTEQLNAVTLIQPDLFDNAASISKLLRTQRADTLKEAINLAIEEERKENQERERREEARRQEAILEEQAYQTRMHERAMEQAAERQAAEARAHAAAMEAQARAQTAETEKLRKELEKQNGTRKY